MHPGRPGWVSGSSAGQWSVKAGWAGVHLSWGPAGRSPLSRWTSTCQTWPRRGTRRLADVVGAFIVGGPVPWGPGLALGTVREPIVCSHEDAYRCFMRTEMDYLVMGNCLLDKQEQSGWHEDEEWQKTFELD